MSIRHLVAKLDQQKVAQVLTRGLAPHKRSRQPKAYPPIVREPSGKWPTPQYAEKLRLKRERRRLQGEAV